MTAEAIPGPPCDICGEEFAAMSLLSYGDYSQVKTGVNCAPDFLRSIADSIDGRSTAVPSPEPGPPDLDAPSAQPPAELDGGGDDQGDDAEPGSARDHWASTTNVRRSTHGHRRTSSATGKPAGDEPPQ